MAIKIVNDVVAPLTVTAIDLGVESIAPNRNELASYILVAGAYLAASMGRGGDFVKNMGIASMPWAAKNIYNRARGISAQVSRRLSVRRVSRYPAPYTEEPFGGARLV